MTEIQVAAVSQFSTRSSGTRENSRTLSVTQRQPQRAGVSGDQQVVMTYRLAHFFQHDAHFRIMQIDLYIQWQHSNLC